MPVTLFMVDDHPEQLNLLDLYARKMGFDCHSFSNGDDCLAALSKGNKPDGIITDLYMPGMNGLDLVKACQKSYKDIPILVLTVSDSTTDAVRAMRYGAWDFLTKPLGFDRFKATMENMLEKRNLQQEIATILRTAQGKLSFSDIIGESTPMKLLFELMQKVSETEMPVLIQGESGVGKELVAKAIHQGSSRANGPIVTVNCGAIPENLIESTLFGHEKGAFTGADRKTEGKFQAANGGTLFLDELGELPPNAQVKLLRALQEKEIEPVGSSCAVPINVRIICATNKNLAKMVKDNTFREDLFYRVNVFPIDIPPLRERGEDIVLLAEHFISRASMQNGGKKKELSKGAKSFLLSYPWPGNVRQLENALYRCAISASNNTLEAKDFVWLTPENIGVEGGSTAEGSVIVPLAEMEHRYILRAVDLCSGNLTKAAKELEISRATLYRKLAS